MLRTSTCYWRWNIKCFIGELLLLYFNCNVVLHTKVVTLVINYLFSLRTKIGTYIGLEKKRHAQYGFNSYLAIFWQQVCDLEKFDNIAVFTNLWPTTEIMHSVFYLLLYLFKYFHFTFDTMNYFNGISYLI